MIAIRSPYSGLRLFDPASYGRWDTGQYLRYRAHRVRGGLALWCALPPAAPASGQLPMRTIGWFPGYPFTMRGLADTTGLSLPIAGLILAWMFWYLVLILMWRLLADARSIWTRWMCLLIAAFFPGQIYFAAIFPISMCIAGFSPACTLRFEPRG
jgi:hypothetical protein